MAKNKASLAMKILASIGGCTVANGAINAYKIYDDANTPTKWERSRSYAEKITHQRNQAPTPAGAGYEKS